jgi:hypothetical protein
MQFLKNCFNFTSGKKRNETTRGEIMLLSKKMICMFSMSLLALSFGLKAETLSCTYLSSNKVQLDNGFLINVTAKFDCNGVLTEFVGDNQFVSCKPQFVLSKFTEILLPGEAVEFNVANQNVSTNDGSSQTMAMVKNALSETGKVLEPQTIVVRGKPFVCDSTQIIVR